jgi:hypothetical protein
MLNYFENFKKIYLSLRISTVPLIDVIDGNGYTFTPQAGGDQYNRAQGGWEWNFLWKRYPLPVIGQNKLINVENFKYFWLFQTSFLKSSKTYKKNEIIL